MNNIKNKNIMKSSLLIIILGMSMAERVCGMNNEMFFSEDMFEALMNCEKGKTFIKGLCNGKNPWTVDKGGFCGGICCAKPAKEWVLVGMNGEDEVKAKLFDDILKTVLDCKGSDVSVTLTLKQNSSLLINVEFFWNKGLKDLITSFFLNGVSLKRNDISVPWQVLPADQ